MAVRALLLAITAASIFRTVIVVWPEFSPLHAVSEWFPAFAYSAS